MFLNTTSEGANELELIEKFLAPGDILFYIDQCNSHKWTVIDVFTGGFTATDNLETKDYLYSELQHGWSMSRKSKETKPII